MSAPQEKKDAEAGEKAGRTQAEPDEPEEKPLTEAEAEALKQAELDKESLEQEKRIEDEIIALWADVEEKLRPGLRGCVH
jgi:hypothetical protein